MTAMEVSSVHVYPVKSCGGISLDQAVTTPKGFRFDREWVVLTDAGKFITQRQVPGMATIGVDIVPRVLLEDPKASVDEHADDAALVLTAPGMPELRIPLAGPRGPRTHVRVWDWEGEGADEGEEAHTWLSQLLGRPLRLVRYIGEAGSPTPLEDDLGRRGAPADWLPDGSTAGSKEVAFADAFPYLVVNPASLEDLNGRLQTPEEGPLNLNRFRGNIVVAGAEPWAEDRWATLAVPSRALELDLVKPCDRCAVPTTNQETGEVGYEPTRTLRTTRMGKILGWDKKVPVFKGAVFFGWNAVTRGPEGAVIARGDKISVIEERDEIPAPKVEEEQPAPAQARRQEPMLSTTKKILLLLLFFLARALIQYLVDRKKNKDA